MLCEDINIRDPYILVYNDTYYMYGTRGKNAFKGEEDGFDVYTSKDLMSWEGPIEVFHRPENFFSKKATGRRKYIFIMANFLCLLPFKTLKKASELQY